jgi:hypothetical protein
MKETTIKKVTKSKANYRPAETTEFMCSNCIHFQPYDLTRGYGHCGLVIGRVSSTGVCDLWEPDPLQEPGDKVYELARKVQRLRRQHAKVSLYSN